MRKVLGRAYCNLLQLKYSFAAQLENRACCVQLCSLTYPHVSRLAGRAPLWGACCVWLESGWTRRACTQDALNATLNYISRSGTCSATRIEIILCFLSPIFNFLYTSNAGENDRVQYFNANTMHSILYYVASALIYYVVRVLPPLLGAAHLWVSAHDH